MSDWRQRLNALAGRSTCRITTRGRRSGRLHAVTIWFVLGGEDRIHLATQRLERDWPKNLAVHPEVTIEIGGLRLRGAAARVTDRERCDEVARRLARKYWAARIGWWLGVRPQAVFEVRLEGVA